MKSENKFAFNWVLINELMVGSIPLGKEDALILKNKGIKSILSLCSDDEAVIYESIDSLFHRKQYILPDHKYSESLSINDINEVLAILSEQVDNGPVYVHCFAGVERSPLICMAWLIKSQGLSVVEALNYMMSIHKRTNPLPEQINCLHKLIS